MNTYTHRSQAITDIIIFFDELWLTLVYACNAFQVVNQNKKLQNTVDATPCSVALVEGINLKPCHYRAMVINPVAIGKTVSLPFQTTPLNVSSENITNATVFTTYAGSAAAVIDNIVAREKTW